MVDDSVRKELAECYEEVMYLAGRPNVTPQRARAWYSEVRCRQFKTRIRMFTGMVSEKAIKGVNERLVLEHHKRLSHTISNLITKHIGDKADNPEEFIESVLKCEKVNITTDQENHKAQAAGGDYKAAGIILVKWGGIDTKRKFELWNNMLRGRVANADEFEVNGE